MASYYNGLYKKNQEKIYIFLENGSNRDIFIKFNKTSHTFYKKHLIFLKTN